MRILRNLILPVVGLALVGCNTDMWVQPKHHPLDESEMFADGQASRPLLQGTIARGHLREDGAFYTGIQSGKWVDAIPVPVTMDLLKRGQDRYNIYCTPCHGQLGDGKGMIAQRGFQLKRPVGNYHTKRLREMPVGHYYDVITNGYGAMYSYASRIEPQDRWAVVAYIKALQLSQQGTVNDLNDSQKAELDKPTKTEAAHEGGSH